MFKALRNTFTWGRASRTEYWLFQLLYIILAVISQVVAPGAEMIVALILLIPGFTVCARRLHDTNRSAWWMLIVLVPIIGWIWIFVLIVLGSKEGDNKYS